LQQINESSEIVCSADDYFVADNGEYIYDKNKLSDAHDNCFRKAVSLMKSHCNVIVDNTNSKLNDYKKYVDLVSKFSYKLFIIELYCETRAHAVQFAKRNQHSVPINDCVKMFSMWESDDRSIKLNSVVGTLDTHNNSHEFYNESFDHWLNESGIVHNSKKRRKTHISFEPTRVRFLDVPDQHYDEFLKRYISSADEPKYLTEVAQYDDSTDESEFRMFFDVDHEDTNFLTDDQIIEIVHQIQKIVPGSIYVTGCRSVVASGPEATLVKTGLHIKCRDELVVFHQAQKIRASVVELLYDYNHDKNWDVIIDSNVYLCSRGIRMFGSRKVMNGEDVGRIYEMIFAVDESGNTYW
jgi:hypothetical protein